MLYMTTNLRKIQNIYKDDIRSRYQEHGARVLLDKVLVYEKKIMISQTHHTTPITSFVTIELQAIDAFAASAVTSSEVASLTHKLGNDAMESAALVVERLA